MFSFSRNAQLAWKQSFFKISNNDILFILNTTLLTVRFHFHYCMESLYWKLPTVGFVTHIHQENNNNDKKIFKKKLILNPFVDFLIIQSPSFIENTIVCNYFLSNLSYCSVRPRYFLRLLKPELFVYCSFRVINNTFKITLYFRKNKRWNC